MQLTTEQQQLLSNCGASCAEAGAAVQRAKHLVDVVVQTLNQTIGSLESPDDRKSWSVVRNAWLEIALLLEDALAKFEEG
jgi:hypothetical protein